MSFAVGSIVIGQHFIYWPEKNGDEGVVERGPEMIASHDPRKGETVTAVQYFIHWNDGSKSWCLPENLRLKRPPPDEVKREDLTPVKWSDCVWRPNRVSA